MTRERQALPFRLLNARDPDMDGRWMLRASCLTLLAIGRRGHVPFPVHRVNGDILLLIICVGVGDGLRVSFGLSNRLRIRLSSLVLHRCIRRLREIFVAFMVNVDF